HWQPLQSLPVSNNTNSFCNVRDEYPDIYVTRIKSIRYSIPTDYMICIKIDRVEATCLTEYQFNGKVKFIVNWVSNNNKEESVASEQSASHAAQLF
ncbi:1429_t:CDS:2, partial [Gigaspora rosea]